MKRILMIALTLMICVCCFASCAKIEHEIGKAVSVAAVDAVAAELEKEGVEFVLADEQALADLTAEWSEYFEEGMAGEFTSGLEGRYDNPETGDWVEYLVLGFSATEDADALEQVLLEKYDAEIKEGKAIVVNGGYIVNLTVSSVVIEQE